MGIVTDSYGDIRIVWVALFFIAAIAGIASLPWFLIEVPQYKSTCLNYGRVTHREVKIAQPNWGTVICYVHMPNGWFDIDQINQNNVAK